VFKVYEVPLLSIKPSKSSIWFTLKAESIFSSKSLGKIRSNKITSSEATFNSQHEMLVDTNVVQSLNFKLKCASSILGRKITLGTHSFDLTREHGTSGFVLDEPVNLKDSSGVVVATMRLFVQITETDFPALHLSPAVRNFRYGQDRMFGTYHSMVREGREEASCCDNHDITFFRDCSSSPGNSFKISGDTKRLVVQQRCDAWSIVEHAASAVSSARPPPARKFVLHARPLQPDVGQPDSPPMEFSLEQTGGCPYSRSSIALIAGNVFDTPDVDGAADWGVWTLVRSSANCPATDVGRVNGGDVIGVIHVAGPCVECRGPHELGLAVAVGNAMLWACVLHGPGRHSIQRLISRVARRPTAHLSAHGTAQTGRGFLPLAPTDDMPAAGPGNQGFAAFKLECLETRMKLGGVGRCGEREEEAVVEFLGGGSWREETGSLASGALVAKELDWCGGTFLGFAIF